MISLLKIWYRFDNASAFREENKNSLKWRENMAVYPHASIQCKTVLSNVAKYECLDLNVNASKNSRTSLIFSGKTEANTYGKAQTESLNSHLTRLVLGIYRLNLRTCGQKNESAYVRVCVWLTS